MRTLKYDAILRQSSGAPVAALAKTRSPDKIVAVPLLFRLRLQLVKANQKSDSVGGIRTLTRRAFVMCKVRTEKALGFDVSAPRFVNK